MNDTSFIIFQQNLAEKITDIDNIIRPKNVSVARLKEADPTRSEGRDPCPKSCRTWQFYFTHHR